MTLKQALESAERHVTMTQDELAKRLRNLADDCVRYAERLDRKEELHSSLGIIQTRGPDIDRLTAVLAQYENEVEMLKAIET